MSVFGWDLPPGCTQRDIDEQFGCCDENDSELFTCATPDCTEHSHEVEDFFKCEGCGALCCILHRHYPELMPYLSFCAECFRCARCQEPAFAMCGECGDLRCRAHMVVQTEQVDDWNKGDSEYYCSDVCLAAQHKSVMSETGQSEERKVIGQ